MRAIEGKIYDALIVGSGASGGWVAKELAEKGMEVLMLEAGPARVPSRDFTEHAWPYQVRYRGFGNQSQMLSNQPVQSLCYACDEYSHQFFVDDHEHPYTFPDGKPFVWIRGRQVGGKTYCWARESYRYSDYEFKAARRDGYGEDWPFSYAELEPYYDRVESYIGVSGSHEGLPQMPDGRFLPPMNFSCGEILAKSVIEKQFGWRLMPDRVANLTVPHNGRPACHYCDQCQRGCHTASYFNSPSVTLPAAAKTGRFTLLSDAVVNDIVTDAEGMATGVHYIGRVTKAHREARAKVVVIAAATLESTRLLLNSRSPRFPNGIGNSSGVLGHYLMDHFTVEGAGGELASLKSAKREATGNPCGFLIPKYANTNGHRNGKFLRGYRFDGTARQQLYEHAFSLPGFGRPWREKVSREIPYVLSLEAQGECLPRFDNFVELDPVEKDAWGVPALRIHASYGENERAMAQSMRRDVGNMLEALQIKKASPPGEELSIFGKNIHECGTARMGTDPKKSVLNAFNQVHDVKNVFVTDGAAFVTQGCYEPTLTIMAISVRAADYIIDAREADRWAGVAAALGCPSITVALTGDGPEDPHTAADNLIPVVDAAHRKGIRVLFHNDDMKRESAEILTAVIRQLGRVRTGTCPDFGNFAPRSAAFALNQLRMLAPYASNICHSKDGIADQGKFYADDFPASMTIMRNTDFRGLYSLEFEGLDTPIDGVRKLLNLTEKYLA